MFDMQALKHFLIFLFFTFTTLGFAQNQEHYYILFSARFPSFRPFSIGGHAFITWRSEDSLFQKVEQYTYGFFPKKGMGIFKSVEGLVMEGYVKNSNRERLVRRFIIEVDSAQYIETLGEVDTWKTQSYNLFNNNCVHFMNVMASKLKLLPVPPKSCIFPLKPYRYIKKLKKLNALRIVKNALLEKVRLRILKKGKVEEEKDDEETH
jgi:PPPDE putative peptidase domain